VIAGIHSGIPKGFPGSIIGLECEESNINLDSLKTGTPIVPSVLASIPNAPSFALDEGSSSLA
jgi:hypothetical protein